MIKYFSLIFLLLFSACSVQPTTKSSKMLTMKTKQFRFSDLAYISQTSDALEIDLYVVGKAFKKISIDTMVCVEGEGCMRKSTFNEQYLSSAYPDDLLKNVFLGKPIYEGKNMFKTDNGFMQDILEQNVDIAYGVNSEEIYFKDRRNKIVIKIREVK